MRVASPPLLFRWRDAIKPELAAGTVGHQAKRLQRKAKKSFS
jgi:hypothetical protein